MGLGEEEIRICGFDLYLFAGTLKGAEQLEEGLAIRKEVYSR